MPERAHIVEGVGGILGEGRKGPEGLYHQGGGVARVRHQMAPPTGRGQSNEVKVHGGTGSWEQKLGWLGGKAEKVLGTFSGDRAGFC